MTHTSQTLTACTIKQINSHRFDSEQFF